MVVPHLCYQKNGKNTHAIKAFVSLSGIVKHDI